MLVMVWLSLLINTSWAEYRVYLLEISQGEEKRVVTSTLDDIQYPQYFPLNMGEKIQYLDSWMCYGRTDHFKPYCPQPRPVAKADQKSNSTDASPSPDSKP